MTIHFHDVSHWNGDYHPTGPTIAKATEGTSFVDSRYATTKARTLVGGWPFAAYHFLSTQDVNAQAAHAYSVIGSTPAMLDVETGTSGNPTWASVKSFITTYRALGGVMHLAYIPKWYWANHWGHPSMQWLDDTGVSLISSEYTTYSDSGPGWDPYGNVTPPIWQYVGSPLDTNAFKGTITQLATLFSGSSGDPSAPIGGDIMTISPEDLTAIANKMWTYKPGWTGLLDETPLGMLNDLRVVRDQLVAGAHTVDEIAAAVVAALPPAPGGTTPAPISDADVDRIATAVLDGFAARQAS